jgi:hypothetical protein
VTDDHPEIDNEFKRFVHAVQIKLGEENSSAGDGRLYHRVMTSQ